MRTFSLGAGKDTVVFSSKAADDANTITGFGTSSGAEDKLSFDSTVFTAGGTGFEALTGSSATFEASKVFTGTADQIKGIEISSPSATGKVAVAIATDTGDIYAVTDAGTSKVTIEIIGNVGDTAAKAIAGGTFSTFIEF